jgi:DNA-binding NtrC family response regulator
MSDKVDQSSTLTVSESRGRIAPPRLVPQLYVVFRAAQPLTPTSRHRLDGVGEVLLGRGDRAHAERIESDGAKMLRIAMPDRAMSGRHARIVLRDNFHVLEDTGSKNGTFRNGERVTTATLRDGDIIEVGGTFLLFRAAVPSRMDGALDVEAMGVAAPHEVLTTLSEPLARTFDSLAQASRSPLPILVHGETGTGKELIARASHDLSGRSGAFVAVNCGALPATLVESELFGARKGAFSGATEDRPGLVRAAHGGTLFLDEIGELPAIAQAALLRVLQEKEVLPIGATKPIPVDFRLVAATHRDLSEDVRRGTFRADLLARVTGFLTRLPPLRERREDLGLLVATLLRRTSPSAAEAIGFDLAGARALVRHKWPRNIRELERVLATALVLARGGAIGFDELFGPSSPAAELEESESDEPPAVLSSADETRKKELIALFRANAGSVSAVARAMGKQRNQIQRWMKRYRIDPRNLPDD